MEAVIDSRTVAETRRAFAPRTPEAFTHDADGNLASDGRWTYEWDGENRLRAMQTRPDVAAMFPALKRRLEFSYDHQGRRIRKVVKDWNANQAAWKISKDLRFVYDGWNLIEERDALNGNSVVRKHVWGPDLSGTMQGAGGVGGLLWTTTPTQTFAASSDANGNIVAWINTATLAVAGRADYSPFGEPVVRTGIAKELPFGFSTKYEDPETGLLYYGFRYLNPSTGRFLNRDPIEELGGLNLYGFVGNDPVNKVDVLGLKPWLIPVKYISPILKTCGKSISKALFMEAIGNIVLDRRVCGAIMAECGASREPFLLPGLRIYNASIVEALRNCVADAIGGRTKIPGMGMLPGAILDALLDSAEADFNYKVSWECIENRPLIRWVINVKGEVQLKGNNGAASTVSFTEEVKSGYCGNRQVTRDAVAMCCRPC